MSSSRSAALLCAVDDIPLSFLTDGRASRLIFLGERRKENRVYIKGQKRYLILHSKKHTCIQTEFTIVRLQL